MKSLKFDDRVYFKSDILEKSNKIVHFFTTKPGGFSEGKINGLNLGFRVGDKFESVRRNYIQIAEDFHIPFNKITAAKQIHSTDIRVISEKDFGMGVSRTEEIFEADGLITNCKNVPIMVFYADCVPILMHDEVSGVIGAIHSGWRGTALKIAEKAVLLMKDRFGTKPENIKAVIGPSIGNCCFETDKEVAKNFDIQFVEPLPNNKFMVDLWSANQKILLDAGLNPEKIDVFKICTKCNCDLLYSYRAHGEKTGRMGAVIMLT